MKLHDTITDEFKTWIEKQHVFFVATAPLSGNGHVNLSPKGYDAMLRVMDEKTVCYMDMGGSGNETSAHIAEPGNGRITIMLCAFEGGPRILRLYGRGQVILPEDPLYQKMISQYYPNHDNQPGRRQIIINHVERIQTSCGYGVPFMDFRENRKTLVNYYENKGHDGSLEYLRKCERVSIDGLPTPLGAYFNQQDGGKKVGENSLFSGGIQEILQDLVFVGVVCSFLVLLVSPK